MSEIFDFLKKTESERRRKQRIQEPELLLNMSPEALALPTLDEVDKSPEAPEPLPPEIEVCQSDKFDLTGASPQLRSVLHSLTLVGEQFRLLRSRLEIMQKQTGIKTVLITSTAPGEGKTFTASCLAGIIAQEAGKRVLLIDADLRRPMSGRYFGLNGTGSTAGLSEVLRGKAEFSNVLLTSLNPEFSFLPSGPPSSNPSELLSSPKLEQTLKFAADHFDWVILDSPPALALSDTTIISPLCDTVILVVRSNSTPSKLILQAIDRIGRDHICGVVLNRKKDMHRSRYYYHYYYRRSNPKKD